MHHVVRATLARPPTADDRARALLRSTEVDLVAAIGFQRGQALQLISSGGVSADVQKRLELLTAALRQVDVYLQSVFALVQPSLEADTDPST